MSRKLTNEEFLLRADRPCFEYLTEYVDAKTRIKTKCLLCNNVFYSFPHLLMDETRYLWGCAKCSVKHKNIKDKHEFLRSLPEKYAGWKFYEYTGSTGPIIAVCPKCGREHKYASAKSFVSGLAGCRACNNWKKKKNEMI